MYGSDVVKNERNCGPYDTVFTSVNFRVQIIMCGIMRFSTNYLSETSLLSPNFSRDDALQIIQSCEIITPLVYMGPNIECLE